MSRERANSYRTVSPVTIAYSDLKDKEKDLSKEIEEAFGPEGLGIVSISDVPEFSVLRQSMLHLSPIVSNLPDDVKDSLEDPASRYGIGWSYGKQKHESGKLDSFKGFFNANPILDVPTTDVSLMQRYSSFCRPNKWPTAALPELELVFKALGKMIFDVGMMLAYHCDRYVSKAETINKVEGLVQILKRSRCHKARLLYYSPRKHSECIKDIDSISSWCGWHTDFSCLTGLTRDMFMRNAVEIECPDGAAGLHIMTRNNEIVKVFYGEDELAYQIGKSTEIISEGRLCATPHCVRAPSMEKAAGVERSTFAMFMQPDWDEKLEFSGERNHGLEVFPTNSTFTFGEYAETIINRNY